MWSPLAKVGGKCQRGEPLNRRNLKSGDRVVLDGYAGNVVIEDSKRVAAATLRQGGGRQQWGRGQVWKDEEITVEETGVFFFLFLFLQILKTKYTSGA